MEELKKNIIKKGKTYEYVSKCNDNIFLFKDELGFKTTFTNFDLGLLDNEKIDILLKKKSIKLNNTMAEGQHVLVYDRLEDTETEYISVAEVSKKINIPRTTLDKRIKNKQWIYDRWFVEKIMD